MGESIHRRSGQNRDILLENAIRTKKGIQRFEN